MTATPLTEPSPEQHAAHHASAAELDAALDEVRAAPRDSGRVELLLRRPEVRGRELVDVARLTTAEGVQGDNWSTRGSSRTQDGASHPDMQLNVMSARAARAVAGEDPRRWAWAGDQLFLDLDLSVANLPPGTRVRLGSAVIEVTDQPHRGCAKFRERFGKAALSWVNSEQGVPLRLRGLNARVVVGGEVRVGDEAVVERAAAAS